MTNEELVFEIQQGRDLEKNKSLLCYQNKGMIHHLANQFKGLECEEDLVQEGYTALLETVPSYSSDIGVSFFCYAYICIRRKLLRYIHQNGRVLRLPEHLREKYSLISLDETVKGTDQPLSEMIPDESDKLEEVLDRIQHEQVSKELKRLIGELPDPERKIILLYYYANKTDREIGDLIGLQSYQVNRIRKKALKLLRMKDKRKILGSYVCDYYSESLKGVSLRSFRSTWFSSTERVALESFTASQRMEKRLFDDSKL